MTPYTRDQIYSETKNKTVCIMGSAPSCLDNDGDFIDSHDIIIRVNNYKTRGTDKRGQYYDYTDKVGHRTDYHYSYYGGAIKKTQYELKGIKAHLCKCPNDVQHVTNWHVNNNALHGCDFRALYRRRENFWIAPVYIPEKEHYLKCFNLLNKRVPTTGFAAIWEIIQMAPKSIYVTGFDFMTSGVHNVDEMWKAGNPEDPIGHNNELEREIFKKWLFEKNIIIPDKKLKEMLI